MNAIRRQRSNNDSNTTFNIKHPLKKLNNKVIDLVLAQWAHAA